MERQRPDHVIEVLVHTPFRHPDVLDILIGQIRGVLPNVGHTVTMTDFGTHIWFGRADVSTLLKEEATDPDAYPEDPREEFTWVRDSQL